MEEAGIGSVIVVYGLVFVVIVIKWVQYSFAGAAEKKTQPPV